MREMHGILTISQLIKYDMAILAFEIGKKLIKTNIEIEHMANGQNHNTRNAKNMYQSSFRTNTGKYCTSRMNAIEFDALAIHIKKGFL